MIGQGRTIGLILTVLALVIGLAVTGWLFSGLVEGRLYRSGLLLGLVLVMVIVLPLMGAGIFLFVQSRSEARELAEVAKEKKLLNMVQTQGKISVSEAAIELGLSRDAVKNYIYDLVGKGLFTGYINWDDGVLYAKSAAEMRTTKCPNCGGERELVGQGIVKCPYCGSELFL